MACHAHGRPEKKRLYVTIGRKNYQSIKSINTLLIPTIVKQYDYALAHFK